MAYALKKYFARSQRYSFVTSDRKSIRFVRPQKSQGSGKQSFTSNTLVNVSETGLAFTADASLELELGEFLMVEFTVPGSQQMACHAKIVRLEEDFAPGQVLLGIQFKELLNSHKSNLAKGLKKKLCELKAEQQRDLLIQKFYHHKETRKNFFMWATFAVLTCIVFYFI